VEAAFSELRLYGVLGSSALRSTYGAKGLLRNGWRVRPDLHRVDRRAAFGQRVTREQLPHIPIVDPPLRERRAETTLAPPVHGGEAEVGRRREQAGGQDRVGPLEEGVGAADLLVMCATYGWSYDDTKNAAVATHHGNTNRIGMGRRASPTLRLARQAIDSHASQG